MRRIEISRKSRKFLDGRLPKHRKQITSRIKALRDNSMPHDSKRVQGKIANYLRIDVGEYRIIYLLKSESILIVGIGKRNDAEVYRRHRRRHG